MLRYFGRVVLVVLSVVAVVVFRIRRRYQSKAPRIVQITTVANTVGGILR